MRRLRAASLLLAFVAATGLVFGTAGLSTMTADRGLEVSVVDDEAAYLAPNQTAEIVASDTKTEVIEYENRFGIDLGTFHLENVRVVDDTAVTVEEFSGPDSIDAGETEPVTVTIQCSTTESVTLAFDVRASGDGVSLSTTQEREVTCEPVASSPDEAIFHSNGQATVDGDDAVYDATVWIVEKGSEPEPVSVKYDLTGENGLDTAEEVRGQIDLEKPNDKRVLAVDFFEADVAFIHPNWENGSFENQSGGPGDRIEGQSPIDETFLQNYSSNSGED